MGEHSLSARMQQKIDTAANWAKATNFVPKKGEIIVYSDGGGVGVPKIKIGDGTTKVGNLKFITIDSNADLSINGVSYNGSSAVSLSSQQLGVPSAFIAKSVSVLDCNSEKIGRVLSSSAANSLVNGPLEIGSTGAGVLWNIPLSTPTSSINESEAWQKLYQIFVYDSGKVYLRSCSSNDTATWTYGTWEKLLTDVNITADNITTALGYAPAKVPESTSWGIINNANGEIALNPASNNIINSRTTRQPITTGNLDYAVTAAMTDGKGPAWTAEQQAAARDRMGIDKAYELIEEITTDGTAILERNVEPDGTPYNFKSIFIEINSTLENVDGYNLYLTWGNGGRTPIWIDKITANTNICTKIAYVEALMINGLWHVSYRQHATDNYITNVQEKVVPNAAGNITKFNTANAITAGVKFTIYGVRA